MYAYFIGRVISVQDENMILETNHIGYNIKISNQTATLLPSIGCEVKIYTFTYVKEDTLALYGFLTLDELQLFKMLINVNGIGPKGAQSILSVMSSDTLRFAIIAGDYKAIAKAPGIGAKTAERLIIDLKDKIHIEDMYHQNQNPIDTINSVENEAKQEAIEALTALGYMPSEALRAVGNINCSADATAQDIIKAALRVMK